jgi:1-deoxy-D-xylulose-5-phosphate synthase
LRNGFQKLEIGKAETLRTGKNVALLAVGAMVSHAEQAAELLAASGIEAEVVNMRFAKPVDEELLKQLSARVHAFVTIEDNVIQGGMGSAILESLAQLGVTNVAVKVHGLPDEFIQHGSPGELYRLTKLDPQGIANITQEFLTSLRPSIIEELSNR